VNARKLLLILLATFCLCGYVTFGYILPREQAGYVVLLYLLLGVVAYGIYSLARPEHIRPLVVWGVALRLVFLFSVPELSDDFYRYLWDGHLVAHGVDPLALRPSEVPLALRPTLGPEADVMLAFKDYYSVYPPVAQGLFGLTRLIAGDSLLGSIVVFRLLIVLMELGSVVLIMRLLAMWQLDKRFVILYALNPLVIIELAGNLHLEAVMIFLMLLSTWLLARSRLWLAAGAFGLAISAKLIPVLFLPFLLRRLGWRRTLAFGTIAALVFAAGFIPLGYRHLDHLVETARYYYNLFEFNGSLFALVRSWGGFNSAADLGPVFAVLTGIALIVLVVGDKSRGLPTWLSSCMLFLALYHLLATTVNPWYLAPLVAFSLFSTYRVGLVWAFLVPVSYAAFARADYHIHTSLLLIEYVPVYSLLLLEVLRTSSFGKRLRLWYVLLRARIKFKRVAPSIQAGTGVLDIGTGNGGVAHLLSSSGREVTTADVKNKCLFHDVAPRIFDGHTLPFDDNRFQTVMLLTVLHHAVDPDRLLFEAARVSGSTIIVMEDVYRGRLQRLITQAADSVVNWEFAGHPHNNRRESEWERTFLETGLRIRSKKVHRFLLVFRQVTYVLHKGTASNRHERPDGKAPGAQEP
jgi:2-polyprenyl-3-methyl-5-hydroxy-6-metoxy-1,4-benzoquinol methylase